MRKIIIILSLVLIVSASIFALDYRLNSQQNLITKKNPIIIGFSLGVTKEERWFKDRDAFIKKAQELGAIVNVTLADQDVSLQISQIENLISQGVKVIIIVPANSERIAPVVEKAKAAGVKIIAYDRLIRNTNIDMYISFDNEKVGQLEADGLLSLAPQGKYAYIGGPVSDNNSLLLRKGTISELKPKIDSGDIELVIDEAAGSWEPEEAYNIIKKYLETGGTLNAIIAGNDGLAFGARQALKEKDPNNKILISGQDAELSACQRIVAGTQTATVYKQIDLLAAKAAEIAVLMAQGETPETSQTINNGWANIPEILIKPILVNKDNMIETIIKDGFHTYDDIY